MERERNLLIQQGFKQLNTQFNRRTNTSGPPLAVHRVKVTFKDEPGEGSGVARSFYTAIANVSQLCIQNFLNLLILLLRHIVFVVSFFLFVVNFPYTITLNSER